MTSGKQSVLIAAVLCAFSGMSVARAQNISGAMLGKVTDPSAAPVSGAEVTITNPATNQATRLHTSAEGYFEANLLPPGLYAVKVSFAGFKTALRENVALQVESRLRLDFSLEIGDASTSISVTGEAPLVESETASLGQVVTNREIENLPIKGRNVFDLAILSPGVQVNPRALGAVASSGDNDGPLFAMSDISINGGRYRTNDYLLDGVSIMLPENNNFAISPTPDGTREFKIMTNSYGPQFGRSGGGVLNVVTKSGTNQLHGSAYEFFRNDLFKANNFFANASGQARGPQHFNLFGASVGAPIIRNKTFVFAEYQGSRSIGSLGGVFETVPTEAYRNGDFSGRRNQNGQPVIIYDAFNPVNNGTTTTRLPFADNRIPTNKLDRVALKLQTYIPLPNSAGAGPSGINNYVWQKRRFVNSDQWSVRIDHRFSDRQTLFGRVTRNTGDSRDTGPFNSAADNVAGIDNSHVINAVLNDTYVLSPTAIVNLRYGVTRRYEGRNPMQDAVGLANLGFPASFAANAVKQNFPVVSFSGYSNWGAPSGNTIRRGNDIHTLVGDETLIRGRHTIVFGTDVRLYNQTPYQEGTDSGNFSFSPNFTQGPNPLQASLTAGDSFASFLIGYGSGSVTVTPTLAIRNMYYSLYLNDQIRFRRFSISVGLRWEDACPPTERYNRFATFDFDAPFPIKVPALPNLKGVLRHAGQDGEPRGQYDAYYKAFGPRVGLSYSMGRKSAFRAGYGIFYAPRQGTTSAQNFGVTGAGTTTTWVTSSNEGLSLQYPLSNPFPNGLVAPPNSAEALVQLGQTISIVDRRTVSNTYNQQWNFNIQRQFGNNLLVELGYAGNKGTHLPVGLQLNQVDPVYQSLGTGLTRSVSNPFYGLVSNGTLSLPTVATNQLLRPYPQYLNITTASSAVTGVNRGNSKYHALQVKTQKRFSKGYSFLASYTKSKLIDDSSGRLFGVSAFVPPVQNIYDLRAERSISEGDVSQQLVVTHTVELPVGKGKGLLRNAPTPVDWILGGWSASGTATFSSGFPLVLTSTGNTGVSGAVLRPNNNGHSAKLEGAVQSRLTRYFDTSVFSIPPAFSFGNTSRTLPDTRSPGRRNYDFNLSKRFKAGEKMSVYLRGEAYNLTNTPYFYGPAGGLGSAGFGVISRSLGDRQMQFSLKLTY
jgi:hypothetical protein